MVKVASKNTCILLILEATFVCLCTCSLSALRSHNAFRYDLALLSEKKKDFPEALNGYVCCLKLCPFDSLSVSPFIQNIDSNEQNKDKDRDNVISKNETTSSGSIEKTKSRRDSQFAYEMRGEILIRIAMVKKEMGNLDEAMDLCNNILVSHHKELSQYVFSFE